MHGAGDDAGAVRVLEATIATMKRRRILASVVQAVERKLSRRK